MYYSSILIIVIELCVCLHVDNFKTNVVCVAGLGWLQDQGNRLQLLENTMVIIIFILIVINYDYNVM